MRSNRRSATLDKDRMRSLILGAMALLASEAFADTSPDFSVPSDGEIRRILSERIDDQKRSVGIVVGIHDQRGRRVIAHGDLTKDGRHQVNGDTVFEIGSVTKVFTALVLANMVHRGEVAPSDPVAMFLPEEVTLPERDHKAISLEDLATHMSGLPRLPDNLSPADHNNPYADYSIEQLYGFLSEYRLTRNIGEQYEYSNLGYGLLGHALALRMGKSYEVLVHDRILASLGMNSTGINLAPDIEARFAKGHNQGLEVVSNWDLPTLSGAGALRSTANDLLSFLEMLLGQSEQPHMSGVEMALDWVAIKSGEDQEMVWHNGGTGGYRSFVGILPEAKVGVVVLSNSSTSVDDIGQHLLNPELPLVPPPKEHKVAAIDPDLYDGYIGRYQLATNFILTITREGDRLFAQATGQQKAEIFPEGERDFFYTIVDAQVTFEVDDQGRAIQLALYQNGRVTLGPRIDNE